MIHAQPRAPVLRVPRGKRLVTETEVAALEEKRQQMVYRPKRGFLSERIINRRR